MFEAEVFLTSTLRSHPRGVSVTQILAQAFNAAEPGSVVREYLREHPLPKNKRIFALGLGKAACAMTDAIAEAVELSEALVITKHASPLAHGQATVIEGDHPIPGSSSLAAGRAALDFVSRLTPDDLLICLVSGGGSALMTAPVIPLADLQALTSLLLASGARIDEVNTLRRHLDRLKGGGLAEAANGARITSLILSDVVADQLEAIASGPTAPDPSRREEAVAILKKYRLESSAVLEGIRETAKPGDPLFASVQNHIVASNQIALQAAQARARQEGFHVEIVHSELQGEAREAGRNLAGKFKEHCRTRVRPFCLLAGGETTVTIQGPGQGGRNQELALATVETMRDLDNAMIISVATDGEDGPTDAAGAVVSGATAGRAESLGISTSKHLTENDAYRFFDRLGDLIKTGSSGTNVNDLVICVAF